MGRLPRVRRASVFLGVALVLPSALVDCSRARRRHHPTSAAYTNGGRKPSLVSPQEGLIREESSIPGVSIWTSKTAAFSRTPTRGSHTAAAATAASDYYGDIEAAGFSGDCQVGLMECGGEFFTGCDQHVARKQQRFVWVPLNLVAGVADGVCCCWRRLLRVSTLIDPRK